MFPPPGLFDGGNWPGVPHHFVWALSPPNLSSGAPSGLFQLIPRGVPKGDL